MHQWNYSSGVLVVECERTPCVEKKDLGEIKVVQTWYNNNESKVASQNRVTKWRSESIINVFLVHVNIIVFGISDIYFTSLYCFPIQSVVCVLVARWQGPVLLHHGWSNYLQSYIRNQAWWEGDWWIRGSRGQRWFVRSRVRHERGTNQVPSVSNETHYHNRIFALRPPY